VQITVSAPWRLTVAVRANGLPTLLSSEQSTSVTL
jgi:hypothetical protein